MENENGGSGAPKRGIGEELIAIFIDMIAPNWPRAIRKLARVFSRDHRNTLGY